MPFTYLPRASLMFAFLLFNAQAFSQITTLSKNVTQVEKGQNDPASYRSLVLDNGLQVLLVSDDKFEFAYASMAVKVGYFQDPEELPGLAHLYEHMLSKGSKKYPQAAEYKQFLADNGGLSNASTSNLRTNYYFKVADENLAGALDRFAWQFIAPSLSADMIYKERNAVDSEFKMKFSDPFRRKREALRLMVNPQHPYHKFATGNLETLRDQADKTLHQYLLDFHKNYYCASRMALVVAAPQGLDELEELASQMFLAVPDNCQKALEQAPDPLHKAQTGKMLTIETLRERRRIQLNFVLPTDDIYRDMLATPYAKWLFESYNDKGLKNYLTEQGWIIDVDTDISSLDDKHMLFNLEIRLRINGWEEQKKVLAAAFDYIDLVLKQAASSPAYQQFLTLRASEFDTKSRHKDTDEIRSLANSLLLVGRSRVLTYGYKPAVQNPEALQAYFDHFTRQNLLIMAEYNHVNTDRVETYYGTEYRIDPFIIPSTEQKIAFSLPVGSPYYAKPGSTDMPQTALTKLLDEEKFTAWYVPEDNPEDSYTGISVYIDTQTNNDYFLAYNDLFARRLKSQLKVLSDKAEQALIDIDIDQSPTGVILHISGWGANWSLLVTDTITALLNQTLSEDDLKQTLSQQKKAIEGSELDRLRTQTSALFDQYLGLKMSPKQYAKFKQQFKERRYQQFVNGYFTQGHITAWYYGNLNQQEITQLNRALKPLVNKIEKNLPVAVERWQPGSDKGLASTKLAVTDSALRMAQFSVGQSVEDKVVVELLAAMMKAPFFHQLRTQEQLGYSVSVAASQKQHHPYLSFYVESSDKTSSELLQRVLNFEQWFWKDLQSLDEKQFQIIRDNLVAKLKQPYLNSESADATRRSLFRAGYEQTHLDDLLAALHNTTLEMFLRQTKVLLQQKPIGILLDPNES